MSLQPIVLDTDKTTPIYELPLKIRQGDTGDELQVTLGKSFEKYTDLSKVDIELIAKTPDQRLIKQTVTDKSGNTFKVKFPDEMYTNVGVFRNMYFKVGDDSTSSVKLVVLQGIGSIKEAGSYIDDFETLIDEAESYVLALKDFADTGNATIDDKVTELTGKMQSFVDKSKEDLDAAKAAWSTFQSSSQTAATSQRDGFDAEFNKLISDDKATFKDITTEFNTAVDTAKSQNTANQTTFESAESKRASDFKTQSEGFSTSATSQRSGFDTTFKKFISDNQTSVDALKSDLTSATSAGTKQNADNQTAFNSAQSKRATDFTNSQKANSTAFTSAQDKRTSDFNSQKSGFETDFGKQKTDFENRFKALLTTLQGDFDDFKDLINNDVTSLNNKLKTVGTNVDSMEARANEIASTLHDVDLTQMATNKADIDKLKADNTVNKKDIASLKTDNGANKSNIGKLQTSVNTNTTNVGKLQTDVVNNTKKFANYTSTADLNTKLNSYATQAKLTDALKSYSTTANVDSKIATGVGQAKTYAEQSIKDIIGAAPDTLDTIGELADAVTKNKDGVQAINEGITKKADKTDVTALQNTVQTMITSISQADYDKLVSAGTVDPKILYVIPDA
ncbi:phage tail protein [Companilactobacillus suantsaicola]|uniref:Phage tail protein n=1 Tax=Companilactobacillus suantsaicola TaxID=2487723 RepID=A0A4Z0JQB5_9LACO|nr:phage tail protein [Companilactobacillus suantsaicola]TGD24338.1 phage tail protein [Companilactobacillus suantsaicola]